MIRLTNLIPLTKLESNRSSMERIRGRLLNTLGSHKIYALNPTPILDAAYTILNKAQEVDQAYT